VHHERVLADLASTSNGIHGHFTDFYDPFHSTFSTEKTSQKTSQAARHDQVVMLRSMNCVELYAKVAAKESEEDAKDDVYKAKHSKLRLVAKYRIANTRCLDMVRLSINPD
jgi:hypothetical protein